MIKHQMFIAMALIAGVAIGYFAGGRGEAPKAVADEGGYVAKGKVADIGEEASTKALRARIAELERKLAEVGSGSRIKSEDAISNAVATAMKERGPMRFNPREWMENLKKNDPERYAQMMKRFEKWRQRRARETNSTLEFLGSIDTSHMSAAAKKTHDELQELLARREELEEQMHAEDISDSQRRKLMDELMTLHRDIGRLNAEERSNLIGETVKSIGFTGNEAIELTETIQDVIDATGGSRGEHGMPPPPDGGPAGGGPGGR